MQKCLILIDGSNFYFKLKDLKLHKLLEFNFGKFAKYLARSGKIVGSRFFLGNDLILVCCQVFKRKDKETLNGFQRNC